MSFDAKGLPPQVLRDLARNEAAPKVNRVAALEELKSLDHPYARHPELLDLENSIPDDPADHYKTIQGDNALERLMDAIFSPAIHPVKEERAGAPSDAVTDSEEEGASEPSTPAIEPSDEDTDYGWGRYVIHPAVHTTEEEPSGAPSASITTRTLYQE